MGLPTPPKILPVGSGSSMVRDKIRALSLLERVAAMQSYEETSFAAAALAAASEVIVAAPENTILLVTVAAVLSDVPVAINEYAALKHIDREGNETYVNINHSELIGVQTRAIARYIVLDEGEALWHECTVTPIYCSARYIALNKRLPDE